MAELNGGQLAILLQNWNHPVIKPFLATAAAGLAAIAVYERGLPIDIDIKRLNHFVAHLAAPELGRGLYIPEKQLSLNHPVSEIFGLLEPELFSAAKITARTSAPELLGILDRIGSDDASAHLQVTPYLSTIVNHVSNDSTHAYFQATSHLITPAPVPLSHTSGAPHTTKVLQIGTQAQTTSVSGNGGILCLAATAVVVIGAFFFARKTKAQKLTDAQLIAYLMLQLDDVTASKLKIETDLKAAQKDLSKSNDDKNQLSKLHSATITLNDGLIQKLAEAEEESEKNAKRVHETIKRLEAVQERVAGLVKDRNTQMQAYNNLRDKLSEAQLTVSGLRDEKSAREREVQEQLQAVRLENHHLSSQVQSANVDKIKLMEQLQAARLEISNLSLQLQSANVDKTKLEEQLAACELAANATRQQLWARIDELDRKKASHELRSRDAEEELEELKKQAAAAEVDLQAKQNQIHELDNRNGHLESTLASVHKKVEELQTNHDEALAALVLAQSTAEEKSKLQQQNEILMNEVTQLQTKLDEQFNKHMRECVVLKEKINCRDSSIDSAQDGMNRLKRQFEEFQETFEQQIREKDSEAEALRQQVRDAKAALSIAQETIAKLEKEKTTKLSILKTGQEDDNDDDLGHHAAGSTDRSQQGSSQQQDRPSSTSESLFDTTTTEEVNGEHSLMPMTESVSSGHS